MSTNLNPLITLDKEIAAKKAAADSRRREMESAAEALKQEDAEREELEYKRQLIAGRMTQSENLAALRDEFDKAHEQFTSVWGLITGLKAEIAEAESDTAAKRAALSVLQGHLGLRQSTKDFCTLLDKMQSVGMPTDEARHYREEIGRVQQNARAPKSSDMSNLHERRDKYVTKYDALIQKIMKE